MNSNVKYIVGAIAVALIAWLFFVYISKPAGATTIHTEWQNHGDVVCSETCNVEQEGTCGTYEGTRDCTQKQKCVLLGGGGGFSCIVGTYRTVKAESQSCTVEYQACVEPTCEELQNCPTPETPKTSVKRGNVKVSQGPNGKTGDNLCQIEWKKIDGSSKVEIRYAEDGVFGNGYKTLKTKDDGAEWLKNVTGGVLKLRGIHETGGWSHTHSFAC